jgi:tetratricopeptide (TPR) repeat protein
MNSFLKAIQGQPSFSGAYHNLGITYEAMNEWDKALEVYQESIVHAPNDPRSYFRLGNLYLRLNNRHLAIKNLEEAIRLDETDTIGPEAKDLPENIR